MFYVVCCLCFFLYIIMYVVYSNWLYFLSICLFTYNKNFLPQKMLRCWIRSQNCIMIIMIYTALHYNILLNLCIQTCCTHSIFSTAHPPPPPHSPLYTNNGSVANLVALGCVIFVFLTFLTRKIWLFERLHKNAWN